MPRMMRKKALDIVLQAAQRDVRGAGTGLREIPSDQARDELEAAIKRLWKDCYGHEPPDLIR